MEPTRAKRSWPVCMATFSMWLPWFSMRAVTGAGAKPASGWFMTGSL